MVIFKCPYCNKLFVPANLITVSQEQFHDSVVAWNILEETDAHLMECERIDYANYSSENFEVEVLG